MVDMRNNQVTLQKEKPGNWAVNGKYRARNDLIDVLLKTMKNLQVKSPVARAAHDNMVKQLATVAVKVEIYQNNNNNPGKVYYVGGATQDKYGTYMLLENSSEPFIMSLPYFSGYLTTRYNTDEYEWRDKTVFNHQFKDIAGVKVEYELNPQYSYTITHTGNWNYTLKSLQNGKLIENYDTTNLLMYLTFFSNVQFEGFVRKMDNAYRDSILSYPPVSIITVSDMSGKTTKLRTFLKPVSEGGYDSEGNPVKYDVDRMYALINDEEQLVTIQYFVFDKLFLIIDDFYKK